MMAATSKCLIDTLPKEIFWTILSQVRNTSDTGSSVLSPCLLVCKRWHDAVLPLICHDIRVTNSTLDSFIATFSHSSGPMVKCLTILVYSPFATQSGSNEQAPSTVEKMEDVKRNGSRETQRLWGLLEGLSKKIKSMTSLSTFSLVVSPGSLRDGYWIPRPTLAGLLKSLPDTCQSVEIDTKGRDYPEPGSGHLCDAIRGLLPQLRYLRLYVSTMCHAMFGTGSIPVVESTSENKAEYSPADAPYVQTILINCMAGSLYHSQARVCGTFQEYPFFSSPGGQEARFVLAASMRTLFEQGKCPANARLLVFDAQPGDDNDKSVYPAFNRRDIVENVTYAQPFCNVYPMNDESLLVRLYSGDDLLSTTGAIQELAESETWKETTNGFRFPSEVLQEQIGHMGYIVKRLPVRDVESWKAKYPRKSCLLWLNERETGIQLLEAVKRDGILETIPVKEKTPEGWMRDGADLMPINS